MKKKREWMPLFIAPYLADTAHLTTLEHGAYMLLIMHYWQSRGLPDDDAQLAVIARMPVHEWAKIRDKIKAFFKKGWRHKRIEKELRQAAIVSKANSKKAREAANRRWFKHHQDQADASLLNDAPSNAPSNASGIAQAMLQNAHREEERKKESKKEPIQEGRTLSSTQAGPRVRIVNGGRK